MGHQDERRTVRAIECNEQIEQVDAVGGVQIAGRFVGQQDLRLVGKRSSDGYPLLLTAGKLRRVVVSPFRKRPLR